MSDVPGDGDEIPMTTVGRSWDGGSGCSVWLKFASQWAGPLAPPISERSRTFGYLLNGRMVSFEIVYTLRESVGSPLSDRVTASFSYRLLPCCVVVRLVIVYMCRNWCVDLLIQFVRAVGDSYWTDWWDYIIDAMASGGSQPGADWSEIDFPGSGIDPLECSGVSGDIRLARGGSFGHLMCS